MHDFSCGNDIKLYTLFLGSSMSHPNIHLGNQPMNGNPMDMIRNQLMTLFMFKSTTSDSNDSSITRMVYSMIALTVIEKIMGGIPIIIAMFKKYAEKKITNVSPELIKSSFKSDKTPTSIISIEIDYKKNDNISNAIIDYITNLHNVKKIMYSLSTYKLKNKEPILVEEDREIYAKLTHDNMEGESVTQIIDLFSYKINMTDLRIFVRQIENDYTVKMNNKLGDAIYYFDEIPTQVFRDVDGSIDYTRSPDKLSFKMKTFNTNRRFYNVIGSEVKQIQKRVDFFMRNKGWYDDKGIPYTLGFLLSGCPGSGKTSSIKCIANETKRHIINVKFHDGLTKLQMENLFFNESICVAMNGRTEYVVIPIHKRIYVFEDVDCQNMDIIMDREMKMNSSKKPNATHKPVEHVIDDIDFDKLPLGFNAINDLPIGRALNHNNYNSYVKNEGSYSDLSPTEYGVNIKTSSSNVKTQPNKPADNPTLETANSNKLSLSCLLNILDGILETPGRIIIMTSNYPETLDRALIRPGRIDLICKFTKCTHNMIVEFIENFYSVTLSDKEIEDIKQCEEYLLTPAEMTKIMFENFNDYKDTIKTIQFMKK